MRFRDLVAAAAAVTVVGTGVSLMAPAASAAPINSAAKAPDGSYIEKVEKLGDRKLQLEIHSTAMDRTFPVLVDLPADNSVPRPTLYLVNGGGGGVDGNASWDQKTDAKEFLGDKNINVVELIGGRWSYFADWRAPDPVLGVNKWQTFYTEELPPIIDAALGTNGKNSIAGYSMAGTSVLMLAITKPGLFQNVAAYSGCAQTSDPVGQKFVQTTVETWGGGDPDNMWGPADNPLWQANDPVLHADKLRGTNLWVAAGGGLPGAHDAPGDPFIMGDDKYNPISVANHVVVGGIIEAAMSACSHNLQNRLSQLGIPATFDLPPTGTHTWGYWQDDLKQSWPVLSKDLY
ncbi:alpha/beta hydrolase [Nocardia sp. CA-135398]|uniref:alpha/beta hydrolase n=1 Tax=Nocardia sp. CA-135398 TaxID=3239977 RepID=UPI003D99F75A